MRGKGIVRGPKGPDGPQGPEGPEGPAGPSGPTGSATAKLYVENTLVAEGGGISLVGNALVEVEPDFGAGKVTVALPRGFMGSQGPMGPVGPQGRQGDQGVEGPAGPQGPAGPAGTMGPVGPQGVEGPQGSPGTSTIIRTITASSATLGAAPGSQLIFELSCPPGSYPVSAHHTVQGSGGSLRFIDVQSLIDLAARTVTLTLTRSSTAVDAEISPQAICISGTALQE